MLEYAPAWIAFDLADPGSWGPGFLADMLPAPPTVASDRTIITMCDIAFVTQPNTAARRYAVIGALDLLERAS